MTDEQRAFLLAFLTWCDEQPDLLFFAQDEADMFVQMGQGDYEGLVNDYAGELTGSGL